MSQLKNNMTMQPKDCFFYPCICCYYLQLQLFPTSTRKGITQSATNMLPSQLSSARACGRNQSDYFISFFRNHCVIERLARETSFHTYSLSLGRSSTPYIHQLASCPLSLALLVDPYIDSHCRYSCGGLLPFTHSYLLQPRVVTCLSDFQCCNHFCLLEVHQ